MITINNNNNNNNAYNITYYNTSYIHVSRTRLGELRGTMSEARSILQYYNIIYYPQRVIRGDVCGISIYIYIYTGRVRRAQFPVHLEKKNYFFFGDLRISFYRRFILRESLSLIILAHTHAHTHTLKVCSAHATQFDTRTRTA